MNGDPALPRGVCKRLLISGRVQGIGFRASTQHKARSLGVNGWVRNLPDGRVEVLAWGDPKPVQQFTEWCRRGPAYAHVTDVEVDESTPEPGVRGFSVRY